jgi:hypothetical protein
MDGGKEEDELARYWNHVSVRIYILLIGLASMPLLVFVIMGLIYSVVTNSYFSGSGYGRSIGLLAAGSSLFFLEFYHVYVRAPIEVLVGDGRLILIFKRGKQLFIDRDHLKLLTCEVLDRGILPFVSLRWGVVVYCVNPQEPMKRWRYRRYRVSYEIARAIQRKIDGRPDDIIELIPKKANPGPLPDRTLVKSDVSDSHLIGIALLLFIVLPLVAMVTILAFALGDRVDKIFVSVLFSITIIGLYYFFMFNIRSRKEIAFSAIGVKVFTSRLERLIGKRATIEYDKIKEVRVLHSTWWRSNSDDKEEKIYLTVLTDDGERSLGRRAVAEINSFVSELSRRTEFAVIDR